MFCHYCFVIFGCKLTCVQSNRLGNIWVMDPVQLRNCSEILKFSFLMYGDRNTWRGTQNTKCHSFPEYVIFNEVEPVHFEIEY